MLSLFVRREKEITSERCGMCASEGSDPLAEFGVRDGRRGVNGAWAVDARSILPFGKDRWLRWTSSGSSTPLAAGDS